MEAFAILGFSLFDVIQKKHAKYASGIFMAKHSELKLDQNVLYVCICVWNYQIFICILCFLNNIDRGE